MGHKIVYPAGPARVPGLADTPVADAEFEDEAGPGDAGPADAGEAVTRLYQAHAVGLIRLAVIMLGDRHAAEDVVQEAFCGLYRRWHRLTDPANALSYVRSSVLNGCRSWLRRAKNAPQVLMEPAAASAEADALIGEEHRAVLAALRQLPPRQREALVLRYFLDLPEPEIALAMAVSRGTVKSTTARALAAVGKILRENGDWVGVERRSPAPVTSGVPQ